LSGGELQRVLICLCLSSDRDVYLLDEPSSHLDIEQRIRLAKVLKRFAVSRGKLVFVVEHDLMVAVSLGMEARAFSIVFVDGEATVGSFKDGLNRFLRSLDRTFRVDTSGTARPRPRINGLGSTKDRAQKEKGVWYE
jgi:ATP-binding cassette subfamily E protein 1